MRMQRKTKSGIIKYPSPPKQRPAKAANLANKINSTFILHAFPVEWSIEDENLLCAWWLLLNK